MDLSCMYLSQAKQYRGGNRQALASGRTGCSPGYAPCHVTFGNLLHFSNSVSWSVKCKKSLRAVVWIR